MVLLKVFAFPVVGLGSVGVMSPLIYIGSTSSTFKTSWKSYLSSSSPVLQDCKSSDGKYYTVLLELNPKKGEANTDSSEISFRVEETSTPWDKASVKKTVWKAGKTFSGGLSKWGIQPDSSNRKTEFKLPDPSGSQWNGDVRIVRAVCEGKDSFQFSRYTSQVVFASELTLTTADKNTCKSSLGHAECPINIGSSKEEIKWKEGSEPKVIYTAF